MSPWKMKPRFIAGEFRSHFFKPRSIPMSMLQTLVLGHEELEALRLMDIEHLSQEEAAKSMQISRTTLQRILEKSREKITLALVNGYAIEIRGGNYTVDFPENRRHGRHGRNW